MPCQSVIVLPNRFGRTARRIVIPGLLKLRGILNVRTVYADTALKLTYNANRIDLKDILALLDQMETETNCIDGRQATSYLH